MKRHHDHSNSNKTFNREALLSVADVFSSLSLWQGAWQHAGSHDAVAEAESSTSCRQTGSRL